MYISVIMNRYQIIDLDDNPDLEDRIKKIGEKYSKRILEAKRWLARNEMLTIVSREEVNYQGKRPLLLQVTRERIVAGFEGWEGFESIASIFIKYEKREN